MSFFTHLLNNRSRIVSDISLGESIDAFLNKQPNFNWKLDWLEELRADEELATICPDALISSVYQLNETIKYKKKNGQEWRLAYPKMKVCAADALKGIYPRGLICAPSDTLRVLVALPWLPNNLNNNMLQVATGYFSALSHVKQTDVHFLISNELCFSGPSAVQRPDARNYSNVIERAIVLAGGDHQRLYIAPPAFKGIGHFCAVSNLISELKPDVIFAPNYELSFVHAHGMKSICPTVFLQTSMNNRPCYDFSRYLYIKEDQKIGLDFINQDMWSFHPFGYGKFGFTGEFSVSSIGIPETAKIVVTAGNRLEDEIDAEFIEIVSDCLAEARDTIWLLLGVREEKRVRAKIENVGRISQDRVKILGYVQNIGDYLEASTLYLNPRRSGGGVSMALSILAETPVLSFSDSDAKSFLIDELCFENRQIYVQRAKYLLRSSKYLKELVEEQKHFFQENHSLKAAADNLLKHFYDVCGIASC